MTYTDDLEAGESYRGVVLPVGMTPQFLDVLEKMFARCANDDLHDGGGNTISPREMAVAAFVAVKAELEGTDLQQSAAAPNWYRSLASSVREDHQA